MSEEKTRGNVSNRTRNWVFICYPESVPPDWERLIEEEHIQWACSPLHDKDTRDESDEEQKKPHWHVILLFDGPKTFDQVKVITDRVHGLAPRKCNSTKGSYQYFTHKNDPDKYQYSADEIRHFGGFDAESIMAPTATERLVIQDAIESYILENNVTELRELARYVRDAGLEDWRNVIRNYSTMYFSKLIDSNRNYIKAQAEAFGVRGIVDAGTGEVK